MPVPSRLFAAVLVALWLVFIAARPAAGHGILAGSTPAPNQRLETTPSRVVLVFSEPVSAQFSSVEVVDRQGRRVSQDTSMSQDGRRLVAALRPLEPGAYTVRWRVLWPLDGHTTSGFYAFAYAETLPTGTPQAPPAAEGEQGPTVLRLIARTIGFMAALLMAGSVLFETLVLGRGLAGIPVDDARRIADASARRLSKLRILAAMTLFFGVLLEFALQTAEVLGVPMSDALTAGLTGSLLLQTKTGWSVLLRAASAVIMMLRGGAPIRLAATPLLLAGFTIQGHVAATGTLGGYVDWLHLMGAAVWIGGLPVLFITLYSSPAMQRGALARALVPRFSRLAGISLLILIVTGVYSSWHLLPDLSAFTLTAYGRLLLIKILIVLPLALLGAVNHFVIRPRLAHAETHRPVRALLRVVTGEIGLGALIVLIVAVLTVTPPAVVVRGEHERTVMAGLAGDLRLNLTLETVAEGWTRYAVQMPEGPEIDRANARVMLRLQKLDENISQITQLLTWDGQGRFMGEGGELARPGWWELEVVVRRRGRPDVLTGFPWVNGSLQSPSTSEGEQLLHRAQAARAHLSSWREEEQLTDGNGAVTVTRWELVPPDRLTYRTRTGTEAVIVGLNRFTRSGPGPWEHDTLVEPIELRYPAHFKEPREVVAGRSDQCERETCRVVMWKVGTSAQFAAWIGLKTFRAHRLLMAAPSHYMTTRLFDFGVPIRIRPP